MRVWPLIGFLAFASGCARHYDLSPIDYEFVDDPERQEITVSYKNDSDHWMCLLPEHWPNKAGKLNQSGSRLSLSVAGESFPATDFNTGYCPTGCELKVAPAEKITATVPYAEFSLPKRLWSSAKVLSFSPMAYECAK
jgi:hypothetical protein